MDASLDENLLSLGLSDDESILLDVEEEICNKVAHDNSLHESRAQLNEYREQASREISELKEELAKLQNEYQNMINIHSKDERNIISRLIHENLTLKLERASNELERKQHQRKEQAFCGKSAELMDKIKFLNDELGQEKLKLKNSEKSCLRYRRSIKILQIQKNSANDSELETLEKQNQDILKENKRLKAALDASESSSVSDMKENIDKNSSLATIIDSFKKKYDRLEKENRDLSMRIRNEMDSKLSLLKQVKKLNKIVEKRTK